MKDLTKIAESYVGCDRDNGMHISREFYENQKGLIMFRYVYDIWQDYPAEDVWKRETSDLKPYKGIMTTQEIIDHPDWVIYYETLAVKERDCEMNIEKIAETPVYKFKAHKGPTLSKTEYFECQCCKQIYYRERWHLEETRICTIDSGYEPEIDLTKEEIITNAHNHCRSGRLHRSNLITKITE
jgi:hypothetical protein